MNTDQLKLFCVIADDLNITSAAKKLHYTQSSASQTLNALEEELQVKLFNRLNNKISLTKEGVIFLKYASNILNSLQECRQELARSSSEMTIRIGILKQVNVPLLPIKKNEFEQAFPGVNLIFNQHSIRANLQALSRKDLDVSFMSFNNESIPPELDSFKVLSMKLVPCVHEDHPLLRKTSDLSTLDLLDYPIFFTQRNDDFYTFILNFFGNLSHRVISQTIDPLNLFMELSHNNGIVFVPEVYARTSLYAPYKALIGESLLPNVDIYCVYNTTNRNPVVVSVVAFLKNTDFSGYFDDYIH